MTQKSAEWLMGEDCMQRGDTGQRDHSHLGRRELDDVRLHRITWNDMKCKTYELFISKIFCVIFLECNWPQKPQNTKPWIMRDYYVYPTSAMYHSDHWSLCYLHLKILNNCGVHFVSFQIIREEEVLSHMYSVLHSNHIISEQIIEYFQKVANTKHWDKI